jgi:hypothetical protein
MQVIKMVASTGQYGTPGGFSPLSTHVEKLAMNAANTQ